MEIAGRLLPFNLNLLPSHRARLASVHDEKQSEVIDQALIIPFHGSTSFTGEPVVEFQGHGGPLVMKRILDALIGVGARLAEPGEFSMRAFESGKIDLLQAEAIQGMIHARSERARRIHTAQLGGALSKKLHALCEQLAHIAAVIEAWVDFPEEGLEFMEFSELERDLSQLIHEMRRLEGSYKAGRAFTDGLKVAFVGPPNAGKSSLLNALIGKERSIVTEIAGTTRDYIQEEWIAGEILFQLVDTAGLRAASDPVEAIGVERSRAQAQEADLILALIDVTRQKEGLAILDKLDLTRTLIVWNKIDLEHASLPAIDAGHGTIRVSAAQGKGVGELQERLVAIAKVGDMAESCLTIVHARHAQALKNASARADKALEGLKNKLSAEFVAYDLRAALEALSSITGHQVTEKVLDHLFAQFCLGK
jgi:tRNA modification GTPase